MTYDIDALIAKAREEFDEIEPTDIPLIVAGEQLTFRFRPCAESSDWRDLAAKHPPRTGSASDHTRGYNITGIARHYPRVALLDGDTEVDVAKKWPALTAVLAPEDLKLVEYTVWGINEYDPIQRALGKAQTGESSS